MYIYGQIYRYIYIYIYIWHRGAQLPGVRVGAKRQPEQAVYIYTYIYMVKFTYMGEGWSEATTRTSFNMLLYGEVA